MSKNKLSFLWLVLSAALVLFVGGRWNFPLAAWLAPVFAMRFFRGSEKPWRDFLLLWIFTAISTILSWQGTTSMRFISPGIEPAFFFLTTLLGLIPYVVDRAYIRRFGPQFWVMLIYPIGATGMDYLSSGNSPFGTFGALAYSQRGFLPVMQLASVAGMWGIAFVINWFASTANHIWENGFKRSALVYLSVLILVFGFGAGRMWFASAPVYTPQVAGFSLPNGKLDELLSLLQAGNETDFRQNVDELHMQEMAEIRSLAGRGAKIIVLQEGAGLGYPDQVERLLANAEVVAKETQIYIVLPTFTFGKQPPENVVRILDPLGQVILEHVKYGGNQFEGSLKGDGILKTVETPYGRLSAIICWDADFPDVVRQAGQQGVELLFIPANDWLEVGDIHAGMATFRAVENGMSIFRQTGQGVSLATDAYARVVNRVSSYAESSPANFTAIQMVDMPISHIDATYPQIGDAFGFLVDWSFGLDNRSMGVKENISTVLIMSRRLRNLRVASGSRMPFVAQADPIGNLDGL